MASKSQHLPFTYNKSAMAQLRQGPLGHWFYHQPLWHHHQDVCLSCASTHRVVLNLLTHISFLVINLKHIVSQCTCTQLQLISIRYKSIQLPKIYCQVSSLLKLKYSQALLEIFSIAIFLNGGKFITRQGEFTIIENLQQWKIHYGEKLKINIMTNYRHVTKSLSQIVI